MNKKIIFLRHAKTSGNEVHPERGIRFLGRKGNYEIITPEKEIIDFLKNKFKEYKLVFSSPSKRCKQTLELITRFPIKEDIRLSEIDYGDADGMYLKDIQKKYSYLFEAWKKGEDNKFPNGENNLDVILRLKSFIKDVKKLKEEKIFVCTHNVILRCLLGSALKIPVKEWYKITIPHMEPIEFELINDKLVYSGDKEQKKILLNKVIIQKYKSYFIALTPDRKIYSKIYNAKKAIFSKFGDQKYLTDPPHCTLYVSLAEDLEEIKKIIKDLSLKEREIEGRILDNYQEFKEDIFAEGGTSIALKFDTVTNKKIIALQKKIIPSLNKLRKGKLHSRYSNINLSNKLLENIQKYGFPFVGEIFIPHIAFCSFKNIQDVEFFKKMHPVDEFTGNFKFIKISLFRLYPNDKVELIEEFELQ